MKELKKYYSVYNRRILVMIELKKAREIKENIKKLVEEQKLDMANELICEYKNRG